MSIGSDSLNFVKEESRYFVVDRKKKLNWKYVLKVTNRRTKVSDNIERKGRVSMGGVR